MPNKTIQETIEENKKEFEKDFLGLITGLRIEFFDVIEYQKRLEAHNSSLTHSLLSAILTEIGGMKKKNIHPEEKFHKREVDDPITIKDTENAKMHLENNLQADYIYSYNQALSDISKIIKEALDNLEK